MITSAIFDLDGVIVFTDKYHYQAWKKIADELDIYFDEEINNRLRGVSRMESLDIILENYKGEELSWEKKVELATRKNEFYRDLLGNMTPADVTDSVRDTLAKLRSRGYKIALGSSSKNAKYILEKVDLLDAFDVISDGNNIINSKPNPEVFVKAANFLDQPCNRCLVVEDAEAGINAGKYAGMTTVAIGDAARSHIADRDIEQFPDLLNILF